MSSEGPERRVILRVRWGPMASRKAVIAPGQVLRVGRAESMGLALPHDERLSDSHFELSWNGRECQLEDLGSGTGTFLGGQRVRQAQVFNGVWIRAGRTDFSVYFEGATPPREPAEPELPELAAHKARALKTLSEQEAPMYAILDAARSERILELLRESVEEFRSLYEGPQGEALSEVAPYLVMLPRGSRLLEALVLEGWGRSWGALLTCPLPFVEVRRHFRKFLMVEEEGADRQLYMRFYDPRVLRDLLPILTVDQRRDLFGPVERFLCEGPSSEILQLRSSLTARDGGVSCVLPRLMMGSTVA